MTRNSFATMGLAAFCLAVFFLSSGCAPQRTEILLNNYGPRLLNERELQKDRAVLLLPVTNQAHDAGVWGYFSVDGQAAYRGLPQLDKFFTDAFEKALVQTGLRVIRPGAVRPDLPSLPALQFTIKTISDLRFGFDLRVLDRGATVLFKNYTIHEDPPLYSEQTIFDLEDRAYRMVDKLVLAVLDDPEFQRAIFKITPPPPPQTGLIPPKP